MRTAFHVLIRVELRRAGFWVRQFLRMPVVLLGLALSGWATTSAFGAGLQQAASGGWQAGALGGLFAAVTMGLVLAQHGYRACLTAGPFYQLVAAPGRLQAWVGVRTVLLMTPLALMAVLAGLLQSWRSAAVAALCALGGIGLGAVSAFAPAPPRASARAPQAGRAQAGGVRRGPSLTLLAARLRQSRYGVPLPVGLAVLVAMGMGLAVLASRNAPETAAGTLLAAATGALLLLVLWSPDLRLVGLLGRTKVALWRLGVWFLAPPLAVGVLWFLAGARMAAAPAAPDTQVAAAACLLVWVWLAVLLLHAMTKAPRHALFAARAEAAFLLLLCGLFTPAMPVLVPGWCVLRVTMLVLAARRGRWLA